MCAYHSPDKEGHASPNIEIQKLPDENTRFAEETDRRAASQGHLHSPLRHTACLRAPIDLVMSVSPT